MSISFRSTISLFLHSCNGYNELCKLLCLPHTIKSCFGNLGTQCSIEECQRTKGHQLYTNIIIDEIHVAPSIRYRGHHLIGSSVDQPDKAAKSVLGHTVETMFGGLSFIARLLPVYSLNADLLFDQIQK